MNEQDPKRISALALIIFFTCLVLFILCTKPRRRIDIVDEEAGAHSKWPSKRRYMGLHGAMATDAMVHHGLGYGTLVGHGHGRHHGLDQGGHKHHHNHTK
ncbi:hypothetical protein N431DRAFT_461277 [Stipitochalara longipes BDJ]|nr:hypothetical protein N431DRAFT_461277 [Stipitochalara longipes BDJ]